MGRFVSLLCPDVIVAVCSLGEFAGFGVFGFVGGVVFAAWRQVEIEWAAEIEAQERET